MFRLLEDGDHIAVKGCKGFCYDHHGIFIGHKEGIIDFNGHTDPQIRFIDILDFGGGKTNYFKKFCYENGQCLPPTSVIANAKKLLNDPTEWNKFDKISNNCEHFATFCKTGKATSDQTKRIEKVKEIVKKNCGCCCRCCC